MILVLPYLTAEYAKNKDSFEDYYDDIIISQSAAQAHPKAAIQIRNREIVEAADVVICYVEKKGGACQTIEYAKKLNKNIINLAKQN